MNSITQLYHVNLVIIIAVNNKFFINEVTMVHGSTRRSIFIISFKCYINIHSFLNECIYNIKIISLKNKNFNIVTNNPLDIVKLKPIQLKL